MNLHEKKYAADATCFTKSKVHPCFLRLLTQKVFLMRVSIMAILLSISGLMLAGDGIGQDLDKVMVSVQLKNATLKTALRKIETQTKLSFAYKTNDIAPFGNINYQAKDISLNRLLNDLPPHLSIQVILSSKLSLYGFLVMSSIIKYLVWGGNYVLMELPYLQEKQDYPGTRSFSIPPRLHIHA